MIALVEERRAQVGVTPLCDALGLARATFYGRRGGLPPAQVWAQGLDAGQVPPCSIRTMYRVLARNAEVRERRNQLRHPAYRKPELLATAPNQVWSWDITKLLGPVKWTYYYLYVLLDIFSRYLVGWLLARQEAAALAKALIAESCERQHIAPDQLINKHAAARSPTRRTPWNGDSSETGIRNTRGRPVSQGVAGCRGFVL